MIAVIGIAQTVWTLMHRLNSLTPRMTMSCILNQKQWTAHVLTEIIETQTGFSCSRCKFRGCPRERRDQWSRVANELNAVVRHHTQFRKSRFTPSKTRGGPDVNSLQPIKNTIGTFEDGRVFEEMDNWTDKVKALAEFDRPWRGMTVF